MQPRKGWEMTIQAKLRYIVEADLAPRNVFIDPEHWVSSLP
jgi:hypothetical protein